MGMWDASRVGLERHMKVLQASTLLLALGLGYMGVSWAFGDKQETKETAARS